MVTAGRSSFVVIAAAVVVLVLAVPAWAGYWQYGPASLGRGHDDANCIWYRGQAACSGWNYWYQNQYSKQTNCGCSFTYLLGFENGNTIRGSWISQSVTYLNVAPVDLGMGGYLKAHITYWSGNAVSVLAWANA
jgi:hypothetical protein